VALEALPTGIVLVDAAGVIVFANSDIESTFGYSNAELIGKRVDMLAPKRLRAGHRHYRIGFLKRRGENGMSRRQESYGLRKDGTEIPLEINLKMLAVDSSRFLLGSVIEVSEYQRSMQCLQRQMAELTENFEQRGVLLQEVHHRVKNNLQIVASILNMHMRRLDVSRARDVLCECRTCIDGIALLHAKLYQSQDFRNIPFADYVQDLISTIFRAWTSIVERVSVKVSIESVLLPIGRTIICGLIVNELVTNAIKYAFPLGRSGTIQISLEKSADTIKLQVSDDGVGMSADDTDPAMNCIGLRLVANLVTQLDGTLEFSASNGMTATIQFPARTP
jgi:PAS domain S-box-containing protein